MIKEKFIFREKQDLFQGKNICKCEEDLFIRFQDTTERINEIDADDKYSIYFVEDSEYILYCKECKKIYLAHLKYSLNSKTDNIDILEFKELTKEQSDKLIKTKLLKTQNEKMTKLDVKIENFPSSYRNIYILNKNILDLNTSNFLTENKFYDDFFKIKLSFIEYLKLKNIDSNIQGAKREDAFFNYEEYCFDNKYKQIDFE